MLLHCFWGDGGAKPAFWDIRSVSSWNWFPFYPIDKISFVHPIYTPMGPYLSIGMDYLIAFHDFTLFVRGGWCETSVLGHSVRFILKPIPLSSNGQNNFCASYFYPIGSIIIHWNGLSDCILCFYIFWGDGGAKPAFWDIQSFSSWNRLPFHPMDKISFVHPIYTPMGPYLSIGMDYLIAFHAFTFF